VIRVAILTVSDSAVAGTRKDSSGPALKARCEELRWQVVTTAVVPDEIEAIANQLEQWAELDTAELILSTGGTGIATRDVTPEATRKVLDRELDGIGQLMRAKGLEQTPFAALSRATAGTRKRSFIVNFPGSPGGALHSLNAMAHLVPHIVQLLHGDTGHDQPGQLSASGN
jgi:molybdopterin adenylyltransferase